MTYTDIEYIKDLTIGIYELLNKKADNTAVEDYLNAKNYPFDKLFAYMVTTNLSPDFINNIDILTRLFQVLGSWGEFTERFELYALKSLSDGRLIQSKFPSIKKFFVKYFKEILSKKTSKILALSFENFEEALFNLIKVYLTDSDTGVYETTADILLSFYLEQNLFSEILTAKNPQNADLILSVLDYLEQIREKNSILVIREMELILNFIEKLNFKEEKLFYYLSEFSKSETEKKFLADCFENTSTSGLIPAELENDSFFLVAKKLIFVYLLKLLNLFYELDLLTQLNFFDLAEKILTKHFLIKIFIKQLDFFNNLNNEEKSLSDEIIRKALYSYSKLYGKGALELKNNLIIKNLLAIAIQFFKFNNYDSYFILTVLTNCFHNKQIYGFLSAEEANSSKDQFDFTKEVINVIIENCWNHNPDIQKLNLELLALLGNFELPSLFQDIFLRKFLVAFYKYEFDKGPENDIYAYKFFVQKLYKDFKLHDYEDYEYLFLEAIYSFLTCESLLKVILSELDLILYLTNRRLRDQRVILKKYAIIERIVKSNYSEAGNMDNTLLEQFRAYVKKGPY